MRPSRAAASLLRQQRRPATTSRLLASSTSPSPVLTRSLFTRKTPAQRIKGRIWTATGIVLGGLFAVYAYDSSAGVHRWLFTPLLHAFTKDDPEASHKFAIKVLKSGLSPVDVQDDQNVLAFELWGKRFSNPVGLAAGFDKHAEAIDGLFNLGFSYVEIGSVTPQGQPGNPQPRMFRLPESQSVINRYGFNSDGHLAVLERLRDRIHAYLVKNARLLPATTFPEQPISANPITDPVQAILANNTDTGVLDNLGLPRSLSNGKILAINLGKNKLSAPEAVDDYVAGVQTLGPYADVLVVNVSSPNTPGLRSLQKRGIITDLLSQVIAARDGLKGTKPVVLLKIAPDLSRQEVADIGRAAKETKVDGIIVSNTTISRPASAGNDSALNEAGGLSGPPLKPLSIRTLQTLYALTSGSIPLIGCGGISSGADALDYAKAGASFVQLYTALGYQGVGLPRMIKDEIAVELQKDKKTWKDIIGSGVDLKSVQQLGRDVNPVNVLGLEGDESGFSKLKREIEDVLAGRSPVSPVQQVEQELPDWEDSPAFNGRAASSALPSSSHSESGLIPEGYPQIIIVETPPKYAPAPLWTKKDVDEKLAQGKELVHKVEDKLADATQATKEILQQTKDNAVAVAHDIADDELARRVKDVTAEVTRQTTENFKKLGKDIKNDEFAKEVKDTTEAILKQTKDNFVTVGRKIRDEGHAGEAVQSFVDETVDKTRAVAHSIVNDGEFSKAVSAFTSDVVRETIARSKALGKAVRDEGHFSEAVQGVVQETLARSKALANSIKHDGPNYSEEVKTLTQDVVNETIARSRKLGQHVVEDGDFVSSVKETSNSIVQEALARSRQLGRSLREDGDLPGAARNTAESIAHNASVKTQRVVDDIKSDSFLEEVKQAFRQATENFKQVGRDIKHDPLLHQQVNLDEAKREVQRAQAGLKEGPTGEDQRNGSGIFKLLSTFGERANVTSESKRIV